MTQTFEKFYIVGGAVRDALLNKDPHDFDIVVEGAVPKFMTDLGFIPVGKSFPVYLHPVTKMEYALCRKEIKTGDKHTDFQFIWDGVSLNEDLERRDFTINAMACACTVDIKTGKVTPITLAEEKKIEYCYIIDNHGGFQDLRDKVIRHVNAEHFIEDPLRVLRACRFAAQLGFSIHEDTMKLLKGMVKQGMLQHLSRQRIDNEFMKAMSPGFDSKLFILYMKECGALKELYPEIDALFDNKEQVKYHSTGNTGLHVMEALSYAKDCEMHVKMAVLYHDVYKPIAYQSKLNTGDYHVPHDSEDALKYFDEIAKDREYPYKVKQAIRVAIKHHMKLWKYFDGMVAKHYVDMIAEITRDFNESYGYLLQDLLLVCAADDMSDKTEACIQKGQTKERVGKLFKICTYIFDTCSKIKFRDVPNYQDLDPLKVKEKQRIMRIKAIQNEYEEIRKVS